MKIYFENAGATAINEFQMYIHCSFVIQTKEHYLFRCELQILSKDCDIKESDISIKIHFVFPYNLNQQELMDQRLQKNKLKIFQLLRPFFAEIVLEEIHANATDTWLDYRLAILFWQK